MDRVENEIKIINANMLALCQNNGRRKSRFYISDLF